MNSSNGQPYSARFWLQVYAIGVLILLTAYAIQKSSEGIWVVFREALSELFVPLVTSLVLTFLLDPIVLWLEDRGISRSVAILAAFFVGAGLLAFSVAALFGPAEKGVFADDLSDLTMHVKQQLVAIDRYLSDQFPYMADLQLSQRLQALLDHWVHDLLVFVPGAVARVLSWLILIPLFTYFLLSNGNRWKKIIIGITPNRYFEMSLSILSQINRQLALFIRGRLLESIIVGGVVAIGLIILDIPYAVHIGVINGLLNLIPYVGPLVGTIIGLLIAIADGADGWRLFGVFVVLQPIAQIILDSMILVPILIARCAALHPFWVIVGVIVGGKLYGPVGMIVSVPVMTMINIVVTEITRYRRGRGFLYIFRPEM